MDPMIVAAITAFGVIASAYLTSRVSNRKLRADAGQLMIDQLQEEVVGLRTRVGHLERGQRVQGDYIVLLRRHIADGQPPPPPPYPNDLVT